jgi:hypothetical protein
MNAAATVTAVKEDAKAVWSTAYINNLPDSCFAAIEGGGKKDGEGKTVPRSLRHYPHHDTGGKLDLPHLRAALSRIGDASNYQGGKAHLAAHARSEGMGSDGGTKLYEVTGEFDPDTSLEDLMQLGWWYATLAREASQLVEARSRPSDAEIKKTQLRLALVRTLRAFRTREIA